MNEVILRPVFALLFMTALLSGEAKAQCSVDYSTTNYFCDLDSLLLHAIPAIGQPPFTFLWETGETTQTIMIPLAFGDYLVTMTDANGCTAITNCHVKPFPQVLYYPYNQNACEGDTVTLFLEWFRDSIPGALYEWSTGETTPTITLTDDITWSVTVTDPSTGCEFVIPDSPFLFWETPEVEIIGPTSICGGQTITLSLAGGPFDGGLWLPEWVWGYTYDVTAPGEYGVVVSNPEASFCNTMDTIVITEGEIPPPVLIGPPPLCEGQDGEVSVTNSFEYTGFMWNTGETTPVITVEEPGTYTVTVTHAGGCEAAASIVVGENNGPQGTLVPAAATCGLSNGSIDLALDPPQNSTYLWSNGSTTQDITNIPPGNYQVTVTDLTGCTAVMETEVPDQPINITITEVITPNTSCNGFNGAIDISILPVESYTYNWSTGATTQDIAGLGPGSYSVTVTTGTTCVATDDFEITDNSNAADINSIITPSGCGESNGVIDLQLSGGTSPFVFTWSNGETVEDLSDLAPGNYSVTVTGSDGCVSSASMVVPNENVVLEIQGVIEPNTSCDQSNGLIDITVVPSGVYQYQWSNGSDTEDLDNIGAGDYSVTVTSGACTQSATFTVTNQNIPFAIAGSVSPDISCTNPTGMIDLTITPSGTYSYQWSDGTTNEDLANIEAGVYGVTVTNADNCSVAASFTVTEALPAILVSGVVVNNSSCQVPNGSLDIAVTPAGTYSFAWSTGETTEDLSGIGAGSFAVTITDENGCSADTNFVITNNTTAFSISANTVANTSCDTANGSIDLVIDPPGSYAILWSTGANTEDILSMGAGSYIVTVTDPNQCVETDTFSIPDNTPALSVAAQVSPDTCNAGLGSIDMEVLPVGSSFSWSTGATTEDLQGQPAGMYVVTITAVSGCQETDTLIIANFNNSFSISGSVTDNTSCTSMNGAVDLQVTPAGVYTFNWSHGASSEDISVLGAGNYSVTVSDASGCTSAVVFSINDQVPSIAISNSIIPETCGSGNGAIELYVTPPDGNTFIWSTGDISPSIFNLDAGMYEVTVTGQAGCDTVISFMVPSQGTVFAANAITQDMSSCTAPDGAIDLTVLPAASYEFLWSNGQVTEDISNLEAGAYVVTITDPAGCSNMDTFLVASSIELPAATASIIPSTCGQYNGGIDLDIASSDTYFITWSDGSTTEDLIALDSGVYAVHIVTVNGCEFDGSWEVPNVNTSFAVSALLSNVTSCRDVDGAIELTMEPAGAYEYRWSNGSSAEDVYEIPAGNYTVTITDQSMCSIVDSFAIVSEIEMPAVSGAIDAPVCGNTNGRINLSIEPAVGVYDIIWAHGDTSTTVSNLSPGLYSVLVIDEKGCEATADFLVPASNSLEAVLDAGITGNGTGMVHCTLQLNIPMDSVASVLWTPVDMMSCQDAVCMEQDILVTAPTLVEALVTDINGCEAIARLQLDIDKEFNVYIPNVFTPNGDGPNDRFTVYGNEEITEVELLEIFDRWGNNVFINTHFPPNDVQYGWDGQFRGEAMNPAVFVYHAIVLLSNGETQHYAGDVTLVR